MLGHFFEVWSLLAIAFLLGCVIGSAVHHILSAGRSGLIQEDIGFAIAARLGPIGAAIGRRRAEEPVPVVRRDLPRWEEPDVPEALVPTDLDDLNRYDDEFESFPPRSEAPAFAGDADDLPEPYEDEAVEPAEEELTPPVAEAEPERPAGPIVETADQPTVSDTSAKTQPPALVAPIGGEADRLVRIRGLGRKSAEKLNEIGIFHFSQIAAWTPEELQWIVDHLGPGVRPEHDDWIGQATRLTDQN